MSEYDDKLARLDSLMGKIEQIEGQNPASYMETEQVANMLEQILTRVEAIHAQKDRQAQANIKLERVMEYMENTIGDGTYIQGKLEKPPLEETLKDYLRIAQASGKVVELLAGSLMIVLEAAVKVVKNNNSTAIPVATNNPNNSQSDFSSILTALSSYIQNSNSNPAK